jgi:hypothetical protein
MHSALPLQDKSEIALIRDKTNFSWSCPGVPGQAFMHS